MKLEKIAIAGAGGIGSNLLSILFDYGYNRKQFSYMDVEVDIYDDDTVDIKNLLHQNFKIDDIGKHKVKVLEEKYIAMGLARRMTEEDFSKYDVVFSCVDSMPFRKSLYEHGWKVGQDRLFWIDGRCTSRQGALFTSDMLRPALEQNINDSQEEGSCLLTYEKEQNISHTLPTIVAAMMVQAFLNKLRGQVTPKMVFMI
jgi:molybdopterin/thiamine biosynthesis adenylyltransferase